MKIIIPFKTPTINHLYFNWQNRRILTKEARELKKKIKELVDKHLSFISTYNLPLRVSAEVYENWLCKDGSIKRKDISNREKFLVDSIFDALGIDDKFIFEHKMIKKQSLNEEKSVVEIEII